MRTITSGGDSTASISSFCSTFGSGYSERESFAEAFYNETDSTTFMLDCTDYYDNTWDSSVAPFDPIDITGLLESSTICAALYRITEQMDTKQAGLISYFMNYFYLLSMQLFIDINEAIDYGHCNEAHAELLNDTYNFCLD